MRQSINFALICLLGCGSGGDSSPSDAAANGGGDGGNPAVDAARPDAQPGCDPDPALPALRRELVASGLDSPIYLTHAGDSRLFAVERVSGLIRIVDSTGLLPAPFLDLSALISSGSEQGLLGLAFHPDYASNGRFFVTYTAGAAGDFVLAEYSVSGDANAADPGSGQLLLTVPVGGGEHYAGQIVFGPDDYLYLALGDGGRGGDPLAAGQDPTSLLGSMLRLDVDSGAPYAVPADNPFVGSAAGADEVWAYGLRVPWRFSFDRDSGDLWIGDVGEFRWEEIDYAASGQGGGRNYGWSVVEGDGHCFGQQSCDTAGMTAPIYEYAHAGACNAIVGGYVYRGAAMPCHRGKYFFADYCPGFVRTLDTAGGEIFGERDWDSLGGGGTIVSLGEDSAGEIYIVHVEGDIYRITTAE